MTHGVSARSTEDKSFSSQLYCTDPGAEKTRYTEEILNQQALYDARPMSTLCNNSTYTPMSCSLLQWTKCNSPTLKEYQKMPLPDEGPRNLAAVGCKGKKEYLLIMVGHS